MNLAVWLGDINQPRARALAVELNLPAVSGSLVDCEFPYVLMYGQYGLGLQQTGKRAAGPVVINFLEGASAHRRLQGGGELIVKAIGGNKHKPPVVIDATAGLARDSFVLASWGCSVTMLERSSVIASLLADGMERAEAVGDVDILPIINRMQLCHCDAADYLYALPLSQRPDVIYIDPMFPASKKSALVKKDMQAFHQVVGADLDSDNLLAVALNRAVNRVVVKRPKKAGWLGEKKPAFSLEGKAIRFDIYSLKAFAK